MTPTDQKKAIGKGFEQETDLGADFKVKRAQFGLRSQERKSFIKLKSREMSENKFNG
jgi:hypothetical protein